MQTVVEKSIMEIFPLLKKPWASVKDDKCCEMKYFKIEFYFFYI